MVPTHRFAHESAWQISLPDTWPEAAPGHQFISLCLNFNTSLIFGETAISMSSQLWASADAVTAAPNMAIHDNILAIMVDSVNSLFCRVMTRLHANQHCGHGWQGDMEGSSRLLDGWRGLLEGVCLQVNDQLKEALRGSQLLLGKQDQVTLPLLMLLL